MSSIEPEHVTTRRADEPILSWIERVDGIRAVEQQEQERRSAAADRELEQHVAGVFSCTVDEARGYINTSDDNARAELGQKLARRARKGA